MRWETVLKTRDDRCTNQRETIHIFRQLSSRCFLALEDVQNDVLLQYNYSLFLPENLSSLPVRPLKSPAELPPLIPCSNQDGILCPGQDTDKTDGVQVNQPCRTDVPVEDVACKNEGSGSPDGKQEMPLYALYGRGAPQSLSGKGMASATCCRQTRDKEVRQGGNHGSGHCCGQHAGETDEEQVDQLHRKNVPAEGLACKNEGFGFLEGKQGIMLADNVGQEKEQGDLLSLVQGTLTSSSRGWGSEPRRRHDPRKKWMKRTAPSPDRKDKYKKAPWRRAKGKGKKGKSRSKWDEEDEVVEVEDDRPEKASGSGRGADRRPDEGLDCGRVPARTRVARRMELDTGLCQVLSS